MIKRNIGFFIFAVIQFFLMGILFQKIMNDNSGLYAIIPIILPISIIGIQYLIYSKK